MKDVFSWIFRLKTSKLANIFGSPTKTSDLEILRYARQRFFGPNWQPWGFLQYFEKECDLFWEVYLWGELYERPPKPPTFWNSYTRTLILDTIMKLSGTTGVTQKTMTLDTHVRLILLQTLNPQERWGTHKKRWPFQPRLFADVIGLVCCSYS